MNTLMQHPRMDKWNDDHIQFCMFENKTKLLPHMLILPSSNFLLILLQISHTNNEHFMSLADPTKGGSRPDARPSSQKN